MKYCAFLLRENFTKTFFIFVFILLGFFLRTENVFGAITDVTWQESIVVPGESTDSTQTFDVKGYKIGENLFGTKTTYTQNQVPKIGRNVGEITGTYSLTTKAKNGDVVQFNFDNGKAQNNTTDDRLLNTIIYKADGTKHTIVSGKLSAPDKEGNVYLVQGTTKATGAVFKNVQLNDGSFNQFYSEEYKNVPRTLENEFGLEFQGKNYNPQSLLQALDTTDQNDLFARDWENSLHKLTQGIEKTPRGDEIFNAMKANYEGTATPEQMALLAEVTKENPDIVKKITEGTTANGQPKEKYVSKDYKEKVDLGNTAEEKSVANSVVNGGDSGLCSLWDSGPGLGLISAINPVAGAVAGSMFGNGNLFNCVEQILYVILYILSLVLGFIGMLFNTVFDFTIIGMSDFVKKLTIINSAWEVFRDLANILFIFLLLYLSIQTILQTNSGEVKHTLSKLIIIALLLNFSLFFTKVIIDSSNILAVTIYEKVAPSDGAFKLGDAFMSTFNFQKLYVQQGFMENQNAVNGDFLGVAFNQNAARSFAANNDNWAIFIMGSIMMVIATFVFIAVIAIFLKRLVVLILLMVTAPIAFVAGIFPKTSGMAEEMWWGNLIKNAFYAPLFMVFMWISLRILNEESFKQHVFTGDSLISTIFGFAIAIAFLLISLVAAESLHVAGAHTAMKWYTGLQSWAGKNTFGRAAYNMLEKNHPIGGALYEWSSHKNPIINTLARWGKHSLHHAANANFDKIPGTGGGHGDHGHGDGHAQGGYAQKLKEDVKERQEFRADQQKDNAMKWAESFDVRQNLVTVDSAGKSTLVKGAGNSHELKVLEQDYESLSLEDKAEYIRAVKYQVEDLKSTGKKEDLEKAGRLEAVAQHMRYNRTDAKDQEQLTRKLEGALSVDKIRFDDVLGRVKRSGYNRATISNLETEIINGNGKNTITINGKEDTVENHHRQAMSAVTPLQNLYQTMSSKQKEGLRPDQFTNEHVVAINKVIDIEQLQRGNKMGDAERTAVSQVINDGVKRINAYATAITPGGDASELTRIMQAWYTRNGKDVPKTQSGAIDVQRALDDYKENMLAEDNSYREYAKNNGQRFFKIDSEAVHKKLVAEIEEKLKNKNTSQSQNTRPNTPPPQNNQSNTQKNTPGNNTSGYNVT